MAGLSFTSIVTGADLGNWKEDFQKRKAGGQGGIAPQELEGIFIFTGLSWWQSLVLASYIPGVHRRVERMPGFSRLRMREIFPEIWETVLFWYSSTYGIHITHVILVFFHVMAMHFQWQRWQVLASLGLTHNLHRQGYSVWKPWIWPCGDCFTFYSTMTY